MVVVLAVKQLDRRSAKFGRASWIAIAVMSVALSITLLPSFANAGINCRDLFERKSVDRFPLTMEEGRTAIQDSLAHHPVHKEFDSEIKNRTLHAVLGDIDPFLIFLTNEDILAFNADLKTRGAIATAELQLDDHSNQGPIATLRHKALEGVRAVYHILTKTPRLREHVFTRAKSGLPPDKGYPSSPARRTDVLIQIMGENLRRLINIGVPENDAYVIVVRQFIRLIDRQTDLLADSSQASLILKSFAKSLDAHSDFIFPDEIKELSLVSGATEQPQIEIQVTEVTRGYKITRVTPHSNAERDGLREGDVITHINGKSIRGQTPTTLLPSLLSPKNQPGVVIHLRGLHANAEAFAIDTQTEIMARGDAPNEVLAGAEPNLSSGPLGIVVLRSFAFKNAADQFMASLEALKTKAGIKGLVLDLRGNTGGSAEEARLILSNFIHQGPLFQGTSWNGLVPSVDTARPKYDMPVVVLVDDASVSGAELTAGVLQDYGRAIVVGTKRTYGKGTSQTVRMMGAGGKAGELKATSGVYYTVGGRSPQVVGIVPDILISPLTDVITEDQLTNHLPAFAVGSLLNAPYPYMPHHDQVVKQLASLSERRRQSELVTGDDAMLEALHILNDLVQIEGPHVVRH